MATALGCLLRDHDARIAVSATPVALRARLDQLRGEGILELEHGAYRASEIALYSSYHSPSPPPLPALTTNETNHCHPVRIPLTNI